MINTFSLHKIDNSESFGFSPDDYSRFKFGDDEVSARFGRDLAAAFIYDHLRLNPITNQIVVVSSPYSFIPTATFAMKDHFVYGLNRWLADQGYPVVQEAKVHRSITYKEDYGELSAEERIRLIGNDTFHIDRTFLTDKTIIFLDDIKITGSHEKMIMKMVNEYGLENDIHMLYFAELVNRQIHPNIENHLNYHFVKSIFELDTIIRSGRFVINTRIVKYILNYDFDAFCIFLQDQSYEFAELLYDMAIGNGYHEIPAYSGNLNFIKQYLFTNQKTLQNVN
jgi:hypothetical protein